MLFSKSFIKFTRAFVIVISFTLTACMSTSDESEQDTEAETNQAQVNEDKQQETSFVKSMFLDMLRFWQDDEKTLAEADSNKELDGVNHADKGGVDLSKDEIDNSAVSERLPAINLYQKQKSVRLADVPEHVIASYQQALNLMKKKQWLKASILLDEVILAQAHLSGPYLNKAKIALHQDNNDLAFELVDKAIEINYLNLYAHAFKAQLLSKQGRFADAEEAYLQALKIWPDHQSSLLNLAILLELYRGKLNQAETYYLHYLSLQPDDQQVKLWYAALQNKLKALKASAKTPSEDDSHSETQKEIGE